LRLQNASGDFRRRFPGGEISLGAFLSAQRHTATPFTAWIDALNSPQPVLTGLQPCGGMKKRTLKRPPAFSRRSYPALKGRGYIPPLAKRDLIRPHSHFSASDFHYLTSKSHFLTSKNDVLTSRNHFRTSENQFATSQTDLVTSIIDLRTAKNEFGTSKNHFPTSRIHSLA
jgi:hypothetical protein